MLTIFRLKLKKKMKKISITFLIISSFLLVGNTLQFSRILGGGGHKAQTSNYNCTANCLECEVQKPHKCHKCLFQWYVDEKTHECKECKVDRCNLCKEEKKCQTCRVGHVPDGEKCLPATWFKISAYILFIASFGMGILFFVFSFYCCMFVKDPEHGNHHGHGHRHGHGHGHKLKEELKHGESEH